MTVYALIYFMQILSLNFLMGVLLYYTMKVKMVAHPVKIIIRVIVLQDWKYLNYAWGVIKRNPFIVFSIPTSICIFLNMIEMYGFLLNMELFKRTAWTLTRGFVFVSGVSFILSLSLKAYFKDR